MSKYLLLAAVFLAAGCSQDPAPAGATDAAPAVAGAEASADAPCPEPRHGVLPPGVTVDHAFYVRNDRFYETKAGAARRRTTLELMDGEPQAVAEAILTSYLAQGYRKLEVEDKGDGITRLAVRKRGEGRVNISSTTDVGDRPAHPASVGIVAIDRPLDADAATEDTGQPPAEDAMDPAADATG